MLLRVWPCCWFTDSLLFDRLSQWNTFVISTVVTGQLLPVIQVLPAGMDVLTWAFATGECGAENWAGIPPVNISKNVAAFVAAGMKYILSTGGASGSFTCGSDAGFTKCAGAGRWHASALVMVPP